MKYENAIAELEDIATKMETGEMSLDELTIQLQRAKELIKLCREKLSATDEEIQKILHEENRTTPA